MDYISSLRKHIGTQPIIMCGACAIIVNEHNEILLHHRREKDWWGLPGGAMELKESLEDTARREVFEEVNLLCGNLELLNVFSGPELYHRYPDGNEVYNVTVAYVCRDFSGEILVDQTEGRDARFFSIEALPSNLSDPIRPILKEYIKKHAVKCDTIKRCIMIFPKFDNMHLIDEVRQKFDPLAKHVRPHLTLAFPFESTISKEELEAHLSQVIKDVKPFELELQGVTASNHFGRYLFLDVKKGFREIKMLHNKVYTGILEDHYPTWLNRDAYLPHMTIGNFSTEEDYQVGIHALKAFNTRFVTTVEQISVEIIDQNEDSIIELEITL